MDRGFGDGFALEILEFTGKGKVGLGRSTCARAAIRLPMINRWAAAAYDRHPKRPQAK